MLVCAISLLDFKEALNFLKFKNLLYILSFTYVKNVAKDILPKNFTKVVPLRT